MQVKYVAKPETVIPAKAGIHLTRLAFDCARTRIQHHSVRCTLNVSVKNTHPSFEAIRTEGRFSERV